MTEHLTETLLATAYMVGAGMSVWGRYGGGQAVRCRGWAVLAVTSFALAVLDWREGRFATCGWDGFFAAFFALTYWRDGGDDDWSRRRRKLKDWVQSHLPRPTVARIRLVPVGAE